MTHDLELIRGNKVNAKIPRFILKNKQLIPPLLRGLFDTDGCLKFSKQTRGTHYYPRIEFCFKDTAFSRSIEKLLKSMNFNFGMWKDKRGLLYYQISGIENLKRWMVLVNPNNLVHKTKYLVWKKYGSYIVKSSLKLREKLLK